MGLGPSDKEMEKMLKEEYGATSKEVASGHHAANDDMQSEGWNNQRAINKYLEKYPEDKGGGTVEIDVNKLWE